MISMDRNSNATISNHELELVNHIDESDIEINVTARRGRDSSECAAILRDIVRRMEYEFKNDKEMTALLALIYERNQAMSISAITSTFDSISAYQGTLKGKFFRTVLTDLSMYSTLFSLLGAIMFAYAAFFAPNEQKKGGGTLAVIFELLSAMIMVFNEFEPWKQKIAELQRFKNELKDVESKACADIQKLLRRSTRPAACDLSLSNSSVDDDSDINL